MRSVFIFIQLFAFCSVLGLRPSPGCGKTSPISTGSLVKRKLIVTDPHFSINRDYWIHVPKNYDEYQSTQLLIWYHGQGGDGHSDAKYYKYTNYNLISVYPQGLDDGNCWTGWNVGLTVNKSTCDVKGVADGCCYDSCKTLGYCTGDGMLQNNCLWSTCYDDAVFTADLLATLGNEFCIDLDSLFASGASNGGMLIHWLATKLPSTFAALMPVFGLPLKGFTDVPNALLGTAILALHDRSDTVIPVDGGETADGWIYESTDTMYGEWASVHGCNLKPHAIVTPYDGGNKHIACKEYTGCKNNKRIIRCLYDGTHGSYCPNQEKIAMWFFEQAVSNNITFI